jgi:hypothetical protein
MLMARKKKEQFIDMGRVEGEKFEPTEEGKSEFDEAAQLVSPGQLMKRLREHPSTSPALSGAGVDAAWEDADVGEESVGGENRRLIRASWKRWGKP